MQAILNLAPFLTSRSRLKPLTSEQLDINRMDIEAELTELRQEIRERFPDGLRAASIREATWLMDRLESLDEPARRYLAHHPTWI